MDDQEIEQEEDSPKKPRKKSVRSRYQFPSYDLGIAKQLAEKVEFEGAGQLTEATLAMSMQASAKSSGFRLKVYAARQFQLLSKEGEYLSTTPLGKAILKPTTEDERRRKLSDAFMAIPLFNAVSTRFKGQPIPPSQTFRNILEREFGVESNRATEAERLLIDSAREAGLLQESGGKTYLTTETVTAHQHSGIPSQPSQTYNAPAVPSQPTMNTPQSGGLLNFSDQDMQDFGELSEKDLDEVWNALGKVMKARVKRISRQGQNSTLSEDNGQGEDNQNLE